MKARLLFRDKYVFQDGAIREMIIWQLPGPDPERLLGLKYRLYYGYPDQCLVRYEKKRGKGDHRHYGQREETYPWVSVQRLIADFKADIEQLRGDQDD